MADEFHYMVVRNMLPRTCGYDVNIIIPPDDLSKFEKPSERNAQDSFNLALLQPEDSERHGALGRFMDAWSKLEMSLRTLLGRVLKLQERELPALTNSLGMKGILDVISASALSQLDEEGTQQLGGLLERVKESNTRRNYLIHGYWMVEWAIVDHGGKPAAIPRIYRRYAPSDPATAKKLDNPRNRKERLRFMFSIKRVEALALSALTLMRDVQEFTRMAFPHPNKPRKDTPEFEVIN